MADYPTTSWDETAPADTDNMSTVDDKITEMKTQIREVFTADHKMDSSGQGTTWGFHELMTLIEQSSNPSNVADTIILFAKEVASSAALHFIDEDGNTMQLTSGSDFIGGFANEIRMWSGAIANIPAGWSLSTDLVAKFVSCVSTALTNPGTTGGADSLTLVEANLNAHTHTISSAGSHSHSVYTNLSGGAGATSDLFETTTAPEGASTVAIQAGGSHDHSSDGNVSTYTGSGNSVDNRPAYYELCFIEKS